MIVSPRHWNCENCGVEAVYEEGTGYVHPNPLCAPIHVHSYVEITTLDPPCEVQVCVMPNCPAPYRWRWNDFFDWTYCKENPQW